MKRLLLLSIAVWCITVYSYCQIDWKNFMSPTRHDLDLPASNWYEAPFYGQRQYGDLYL